MQKVIYDQSKLNVVQTSNKKLKEAREKGKRSVILSEYAVVELFWYEGILYMANMIEFEKQQIKLKPKTEQTVVEKQKITLRNILDMLIHHTAEFRMSTPIIKIKLPLSSHLRVKEENDFKSLGKELYYSNGMGEVQIKFDSQQV